MTSAIQDMSVAEVRKALGEVRRRAATHTSQNPMYITDSLTPSLTVQDFCLKFVCGHHDKRHNKGRRVAAVATVALEDDEGDDDEGDND